MFSMGIQYIYIFTYVYIIALRNKTLTRTVPSYYMLTVYKYITITVANQLCVLLL